MLKPIGVPGEGGEDSPQCFKFHARDARRSSLYAPRKLHLLKVLRLLHEAFLRRLARAVQGRHAALLSLELLVHVPKLRL